MRREVWDDLFEDFTEVLSDTDQLLLLEVFAAGEDVIAGADSRSLCRAIRTRGKVDPIYVSSASELSSALSGILKAGDIVLTLGAGDIGAASAELLNDLKGFGKK